MIYFFLSTIDTCFYALLFILNAFFTIFIMSFLIHTFLAFNTPTYHFQELEILKDKRQLAKSWLEKLKKTMSVSSRGGKRAPSLRGTGGGGGEVR